MEWGSEDPPDCSAHDHAPQGETDARAQIDPDARIENEGVKQAHNRSGSYGMKRTASISTIAVVLALANLTTATALAQTSYPTKPVRIIAPFPPGDDVIGGTPEELAAHLKTEVAKMGRVIKERGMRAN